MSSVKSLVAGLLFVSTASSRALNKRECTFSITAVAEDTCSSLAADWGISLANFIGYNPSVGTGCSTGVKAGTDYCVEMDNGVPPPGQTTTSTSSAPVVTPPTTTTVSAPGPTFPVSPTQDGLISTCQRFYQVASGDSCQKIVDSYGTFTLDQFYSWNPAIGTSCSGLWVSYYVCVGIPGTPTTKPTTAPTPTFTASPVQDGIISTCKTFYKVASGDSCQKIVDSYGTFTLANFYSWNPAVKTDCSGLWVDYYVCVGIPGTPTTTSKAPATPTPTVSPTQPGIISTCKAYYKVTSGDSCQGIVDKYKTFTLSDFYTWNPAVGNTCSSLWVDYYVCVGTTTGAKRREIEF